MLLISIFNNFLFPIAKEHYSIKHKFVSLLVGIAERTWPQRWETFLPELFQRVNSAGYEIQSEIAMMVICSILEDVTDTDFNTALPSDRRRLTTTITFLFLHFNKLTHTFL